MAVLAVSACSKLMSFRAEHLEGDSILELIQKHLQLAHTDDKVWQAELILYIPAQRPKF